MVVIVWYRSLAEFEPRTWQGIFDRSSYNINVIKVVSDLRQVSGFFRFPPPIKLTSTI